MYYVNVYRMGGPAQATWRAAVPVDGVDAAKAQAATIERMGYKTLTKTLTEHQIVGLPVGWCAKCDPFTGKCPMEVCYEDNYS